MTLYSVIYNRLKGVSLAQAKKLQLMDCVTLQYSVLAPRALVLDGGGHGDRETPLEAAVDEVPQSGHEFRSRAVVL